MYTTKKWVLRIVFSVTLTYLCYIVLSNTLVWQILSLSGASRPFLEYWALNVAPDVLGLKSPSVIYYFSLSTVARALVLSVLSTMTFEVSLRKAVLLKSLIWFVKVWMNMKSYYDFIFFITVRSSFKEFKCVIQKLDDLKIYLEICQTKKLAEILQKIKNSSKIWKTQKNRSLSNFKSIYVFFFLILTWHMSLP